MCSASPLWGVLLSLDTCVARASPQSFGVYLLICELERAVTIYIPPRVFLLGDLIHIIVLEQCLWGDELLHKLAMTLPMEPTHERYERGCRRDNDGFWRKRKLIQQAILHIR